MRRHVISECCLCISVSDGWSWSHNKVSCPRGRGLTSHRARPMLEPLTRQKHSRCGSLSSSIQLMSLSGKNESLSPVPTLQSLRSKREFKCVHECLFVRTVSWASGHLGERTHTYTRTHCKPRVPLETATTRSVLDLQNIFQFSNRNRLLWNISLQLR